MNNNKEKLLSDPDRLMTAAEIVLRQGLEVWLSPHLHDKDEEETLYYTIACAEKAEQLRQRFSKLVFILGCELTLFMQGYYLETRSLNESVVPILLKSLKQAHTTNCCKHFFLKQLGMSGMFFEAKLRMLRSRSKPLTGVCLITLVLIIIGLHTLKLPMPASSRPFSNGGNR